MWLSSTAQQALHAVLCIAGSESEGAVRVDEIAAALDCPRWGATVTGDRA